MDHQQVSQLMLMIETMYKNCFNTKNPNMLMNMWEISLQDADFEFVMKNFKEHIKTEKFAPKPSDLLIDKRKLAIGGRYIPDVEETRRNMMRIEQERHLALTTSIPTVSSEELEQLKKETLRKLAEASKRNRENRDVYGGTV